MKNFKDTVYSIFLGEDVTPSPKAKKRMNRDEVDGRPTTPKQKLSIDDFNARMDAEDAKEAASAKAFDDAKKTQGVKDTTVVTSSGVKRSLTAAEAQQAAKAAGVESPFGNARPGEGLLTPDERARINQVQQNPGDTTSRIVFQDKEQIDSNKIFNRTTGQWEQGPPRSKGRARPAGMPSGQHIDGMRDEEDTSIPYDPEKEKQMRADSAKQLGDIIRKNEAQKEKESTPEGRRGLDTEKRATMGLGPRSDKDFAELEKRRLETETKEQARKDFQNSEEGKAARFKRSQAKKSGSTSASRAQADEDYRIAQDAAARKSAPATAPAAAPATAPATGGISVSAAAGGVTKYPTPGIDISQPVTADSLGLNNPDQIDIEIQNNPTPRVEGSSEDSELNRQNQENDKKRKGYIKNGNNPIDDDNPPQNFPPSEDIPRKRQPKFEASETLFGSVIEKGKNPMNDGYMINMNKALTFFAEQLKRKYIEEEVVNPENQPMTKSEISHRNKIRNKSPAKDARAIKGSDTKENAAYRLATYITMRGRKAKKKENK